MDEKTNVMRILDQKKVKYTEYTYLNTDAVGGQEVAEALGEDANKVFKTLVTVGKTGNHYVFLVPVNKELSLKKAAKAVGEKKVEMIKSKELLPLTGYIHGGCSPIGMKKQFSTYIDSSCLFHKQISISAGQRGQQILLSARALIDFIHATTADITRTASSHL